LIRISLERDLIVTWRAREDSMEMNITEIGRDDGDGTWVQLAPDLAKRGVCY
jgi:hypothetical protein